jgi:osmotically-inducible protein OsmY
MVTANGRSVVLTGQVASKRDSQIAEKMAKMEPGVESVVNQLMVIPNQ